MKHLFAYPTIKSAISLFVCLIFIIQLTSCGTIMYPERRGLTRDPAQMDVRVVVMDGVLLLFFVLPGVIAYAVDFSTGCIYLPPGQIMRNMDGLNPADRQVIRVAPEELNSDMLPGIVEQHTGVSIAARAGDMRIFRPDFAGNSTGDIDVRQELSLLNNGQAPNAPGTWYAGGQIRLIADADGRVTNVTLIVPLEARLTGE